MRRIPTLLVVGGLTLCPSLARGQVQWPLELQLGALTSSTKRSASLDDEITGRLSSSVKGIEGRISPIGGGAGIGGRILTGTYGADKFKLREGRIFLGENWLTLEGAYGERSIFGTDSTVLFTRVGIRSTISIGGTGASVRLDGSKYLQGDFSSGKSGKQQPDGWEGEIDIFYK
jgi:hypothetical protein